MKTQFNTFNKELIAIFNYDYPNTIKYDLCCKLLSKFFGASYVSMLLYASKTDRLVCKGAYLDIDHVSFGKKTNIGFKELLKYKDAIEFLISKNQTLSALRDYQALFQAFSKSVFFDKRIKENQFSLICQNFAYYLSFYRTYRTTLENDAYNVDDNSPSASYFKTLLSLNGEFTNEFKFVNLATFQQKDKPFSNLLNDKIGAKINDAGWYIGIPLYATERYFGVIRLMYDRPDKALKAVGDNIEPSNVFKERLINASQTISLHLETNYYLDGYKKLTFNEHKITDDLAGYNSICETITEVVNCNGALMRVYNENTDEIEMVGFSKTMEPYFEFLKTYNDPEYPDNNSFSKSLREIFNKEKKIVAACFPTHNPEIQKVRIFFFDENNNLIHQTKDERMLDLRSAIYRKKLRELSIDEITVVPIPGIKSSYMTFTNTRNRNFINADVEMISLAAKRVGLEIKHFQDSIKIKEHEHSVARIDSIRNVVHQVGAPLHGILLHANNFLNNNIPESRIRERAKYIYYMIRQSISQLKRFQRILELEDSNIKIKRTYISSFTKYLINKSIDYQAYAGSKGITVHVIPISSTNNDAFETDEELMDEVISNLLDNAIKYSFTADQMLRKGIAFNPNNLRSEGNVLITVNNAFSRVEIAITNWGLTVPDKEKIKIFEKGYRSATADEFSPVGSGIGLYLVKKIITALKGEITVHNNEKYKTTFKIILYK